VKLFIRAVATVGVMARAQNPGACRSKPCGLIFADGAIAKAARYHVVRVFRLESYCRGKLLSLLLWAAQAELFANSIVWAPASETAAVAAGQGR
jgi:hypothetical protein